MFTKDFIQFAVACLSPLYLMGDAIDHMGCVKAPHLSEISDCTISPHCPVPSCFNWPPTRHEWLCNTEPVLRNEWTRNFWKGGFFYYGLSDKIDPYCKAFAPFPLFHFLFIKHISLEPFLSLSPVFAVFFVFAVPLLWLAGLLLLDFAIMGGDTRKF